MIHLLLMAVMAMAKSPVSFNTPYIFDMLKGAPATGGFVKIQNPTDKSIQISFVSADQFKVVENHRTVEKNGRMAMERVNQFIVPARGQFELKPGGYHIMFFEPKKDLIEGDKVRVFYKANGIQYYEDFNVVSRMP